MFMRFHVNLIKTFSDFWQAKGKFSQLARVPVQRSLLIALAILGVVVGGFYMIHYQPNVKNLWEMSDLERYVEWHESLALGEKQEAVTKLANRMTSISSLIDSSEGTAAVMARVTKDAEETGVDFVTINPMVSRQEEEYMLTPVNLTICARYADLVRFVRKLEKSEKMINVVSMNISMENKESEVLRVTITIEIYKKSGTSANGPKVIEG